MSEVLGHTQQLALLKSMRNQSLVFTGPEGVGRRKVAHWLSRWLNCAAGDCRALSQSASGVCASCTIEHHPDTLEITPDLYTKDKKLARNPQIKLEQIVPRQGEDGGNLLEWLETRPQYQRKLAIIDSAHLMNENAANALLKMLEEPPSYAVLVLIAPSKSHILPTLASRTVEVAFGRLPDQLLLEHFPKADPEALLYADGSVGKLKQLLEQPQDFKLLLDNTQALLEGLHHGPYTTYTNLNTYLQQGGTLDNLVRKLKQHFGLGQRYATAAHSIVQAQDALSSYVNEDLVLLDLAYVLSTT